MKAKKNKNLKGKKSKKIKQYEDVIIDSFQLGVEIADTAWNILDILRR